MEGYVMPHGFSYKKEGFLGSLFFHVFLGGVGFYLSFVNTGSLKRREVYEVPLDVQFMGGETTTDRLMVRKAAPHPSDSPQEKAYDTPQPEATRQKEDRDSGALSSSKELGRAQEEAVQDKNEKKEALEKLIESLEKTKDSRKNRQERLEVTEKLPLPTKAKEEPKKKAPAPSQLSKNQPSKNLQKKSKKKRTMASLLKTLETKEHSKSPTGPMSRDGHDLPLGEKLSVSEIDFIKRTFYSYWYIPQGAYSGGPISVVIRLSLYSDGTLEDAKVVTHKSTVNHPFFQATAESALRAVLHPDCYPLPLPKERYASWRVIELNFVPRL